MSQCLQWFMYEKDSPHWGQILSFWRIWFWSDSSVCELLKEHSLQRNNVAFGLSECVRLMCIFKYRESLILTYIFYKYVPPLNVLSYVYLRKLDFALPQNKLCILQFHRELFSYVVWGDFCHIILCQIRHKRIELLFLDASWACSCGYERCV